MADRPARDRAVEQFRKAFDRSPHVLVRAPGRVNLIGEHTDYNGGFVLPMALDQATFIATEPRDDHRIRVVSEDHRPVGFSTRDSSAEKGWGNYAKGMVVRLEDAGLETTGFNAAIATDIPIGAGLSSSAALEVGIGLAIAADVDRVELAHHAQWVENEWMGMPSGIMDQLIIATATAGHAKLIDCRSLDSTDHQIPEDVAVVVLDTTTRRSLMGSEYAERRASCERVAHALGVQLLRDATLADINDAALDVVDRARARHVIEENDRTVLAARALASREPIQVGQLMKESHTSMRNLFDISSPALNAIVEAADSAPGCYGARMTGGGFAGCAVALVDRSSLDDFIDETTTSYRISTGLSPTIYPSYAAGAAAIEAL
ncbi:MAG: galactokinase [Acidimicrobiia bacterium]|nr:galactokinase [Acidimicrobiia bacterium]